MSKVTQYRIVDGFDPLTRRNTIEALTNTVVHLLRDGWQPLGGVAVNEGGYFQAMVRYVE